MKATSIVAKTRNIVLGSLTVMAVFIFVSCAKKISFLNSSVVPAARGSVKVKKDKNSNYDIQVDLINLAEVKRLQPSKQAYIVWMETADNVTKNIGQINSSSSMLSKRLKASFETVSAVKPTKIFITAEDDVAIQYPGAQLVLTTDTF